MENKFLDTEVIGVWLDKHDKCKYRISFQKIKKTIYYYMERLNGINKNGKYPVDIEEFKKLVEINHFKKLKQK